MKFDFWLLKTDQVQNGPSLNAILSFCFIQKQPESKALAFKTWLKGPYTKKFIFTKHYPRQNSSRMSISDSIHSNGTCCSILIKLWRASSGQTRLGITVQRLEMKRECRHRCAYQQHPFVNFHSAKRHSVTTLSHSGSQILRTSHATTKYQMWEKFHEECDCRQQSHMNIYDNSKFD